MTIEFTPLTEQEELNVTRIAVRALEEMPCELSTLDIFMDISAAHTNCPLDFEKLLQFDSGNFCHDVAGINRHLNRQTGELEDCFLPRCAKPGVAACAS